MVTTKNSAIYLDNLASTPLDPAVLDAMMPWLTTHHGNPHALTHASGRYANVSVEKARTQIAEAIQADPISVIFTSGATEANNLAIRGVAAAATGKRRRILVARIEHKSVLETAQSLREDHFPVAILKVGKSGLVDVNALQAAVDQETLLVSVMAVNNETGVIQPIFEIADVCRNHGALFHVDCAQALGKIPVHVKAAGADLMSFSAHKVYGPKGVGALYIRRKPRVPLKAMLTGGGQERGLRPGTLPVPLCVGFGMACRLLERGINQEQERIAGMAKQLYNGIVKLFPGARLNGHSKQRVAGALNVLFPGAAADDLLRAFDGLELSTGSACVSTTSEPSHVLKAMGLTRAQASCSVRFGIGRFNTEQEIERALEIIAAGLQMLDLRDSSTTTCRSIPVMLK